jgi:site-specific DNA recombinase
MYLPKLWTSSDYYNKQKFQRFIFPEGITYNKKTDQCRTTSFNLLFSYITHLTGVLDGNKKAPRSFFSMMPVL